MHRAAAVRLLALPALAAAVLLAACGSSGATASGGSSSTSSPEPAISTLPSMSFTPESSARVTGTVSPARGGTLKTEASDGTKFTLEVPPGAVSKTMELSLTPETTQGGIPQARSTSSVAMGPDGTVFAEPLRLTITPPTPVAATDQFLFTSQADGHGVQPALVDPGSTEAVALIMHFSNAGLVSVPAEDDSALLTSQADTAANDLAARIAATSQIIRRDQLTGDTSSTLDVTTILDQYRTAVVEPKLANASSSCSAAKDAIAAVSHYDRQRQLLGVTADPTMSLDELQSLDQGACEKEAIAKCVEAKDPSILGAFWLSQNRMRELIGQPAEHDVSTIEADARKVCSPVSGFALDPEDGGNFSDSDGGQLGAPGTVAGDVCDPLSPFTLEGGGGVTATFTPDSTGEAGTMEWTAKNPIVDESGTGSYSLTWDGTSGHLHLDAKGHFTWIGGGSQKPSGPVTGTAEFNLTQVVNATCE